MKALTFLALAVSSTVAFPAQRWNNPPDKIIPGLHHRTFHSGRLHADVGFNIYFPPGYFSPANDKRFPVVYHLSGMGDHESTELGIVSILDQSIRAGKVPPVILVMVNGGGASFYADSADGSVPVESMIMRELIPHIDAHFRTRAAREGRALHEFSMGGFGALKLVFKYPESFASVTAYVAGMYDGRMLQEKLPKVISAQFGGDPARFDHESPKHFGKQNADQLRAHLSIRLVVGSRERLLDLCRTMHRFLDDQHIPHEYEEVAGVGHDANQMYQKVGARGLQFLVGHLAIGN